MGVKDLWTVLGPVSEKKSLWELENKNIAIDLSAWVCDSQHVGDTYQRNMYLRNLFFRTSFLLILKVQPVFVLEGVAPEIKHATIEARSQARGNTGDSGKSISRNHLRSLQKQCEKLLQTMGVPCVQATGEAEAYCAWLNQIGVVDAVITQDSDSFLYGANVVYRNFAMSPTYACEEYNINVIEEKLNLGRNKLLAISLLCGCDYTNGVTGVGKESAVKFLSTLEESEVIERLRDWREKPIFKYLERQASKNLTPEERLEISIRKKALQIEDFPSDEIINEYLCNKGDEIPTMEWLKPHLTAFLKIAEKKLGWEESYAIDKFLPLMTRWHLMNPSCDSPVKCDSISRKRVVRGVKCYELRWIVDLIPQDGNIELVTTEPQDMVSKVYPDLVEKFIASTVKPKKSTRKVKKDTQKPGNVPKEVTNVESLLLNLSLDDIQQKQPNKKRIKNKEKGLQKIDMFFKVKKGIPVNSPLSQSTPSKYSNRDDHDVSLHFTDSPSPLKHGKGILRSKSECNTLDTGLDGPLFDNSESSLNMSTIINTIVNRKSSNPAVSILLKSKNM